MSFSKFIAAGVVAVMMSGSAMAADNPADLNDLQIAHVAYTADNIDIRYAHLALAISSNPAIQADSGHNRTI